MQYQGREIVLHCNSLIHGFTNRGNHNPVLYDIDLMVEAGSIVSIVGPSGCGKSTLLRAIVGTHPANSGQVLKSINGRTTEVRNPSRDIGIVYQAYSVPPWLTTINSVIEGPILDGTSALFRMFRPFKYGALKKEFREEAKALLERMGLGDSLDLYQSKLSGGMRQRVALAMALIMKPRILLLDEPFGALDEATREELQLLLLELYAENEAARAKGEAPPHTILIVTHELNEAIYVADRLIGISQFWDWRGAGHDIFPGARKVYDMPAPIYRPDEPKDVTDFMKQRKELRRAVFDEEFLQPADEYVRYWDIMKERGP